MTRDRLTAQLLAGPPALDVLDVAGRRDGLTASDVDNALSRERSLVITWLNRGTLHLVRTDDYPRLRNLTTPPLLTANSRRLSHEGVSPADVFRRRRSRVGSR